MKSQECGARDRGYVCTLTKGHDGPHEANGTDPLVVWSTEPKKYKQLKLITLKAIGEAGVHPDCLEFRHFLNSVIDANTCYTWSEIPPELALRALEEAVPGSVWFYANGFLEEIMPEKPERFWSLGEEVRTINCGYGVVNQVDVSKCCIMMPTHNRNRDPVTVENPNRITLDEMRQMGYAGE